MVAVFKFGGASVSTAENIINVGSIISKHKHQKLVIIISAIGKTTNALEQVAQAFYKGDNKEALDLFNQIKITHNNLAAQLISDASIYTNKLLDFYTEAEWLLNDKPVRSYDYYYDQIVCLGELLSTTIISCYLSSLQIKHSWLDVRDIIKTDNNFRDANILWAETEALVNQHINHKIETENIIITQGFIGCTYDNESTTLGREGSDYTAAVLANLTNAQHQTIWKDVAGVMNADPKKDAEAVLISELNYDEVIEMSFYGAQIIHPKTIKPLQNKSIPLYVKCFLDVNLPGTVIHNQPIGQLPPIKILMHNQVLVTLKSKDFSFISEGATNTIYNLLNNLKLKPNLTQNSAISMLLCMDNKPDKIERFALEAAENFDVQVNNNLSLITIRHYTNALLQSDINTKQSILLQQSPSTVQCLFNSQA
jgi:aspartate kinase